MGAHHGRVSEEPPESRPAAAPDPDHESTRVIPPDRQPATPKQRFADRLWSLRAVIAVALAIFLLSGGEHVGKKTVNSDADLPPIAEGKGK